MLFTQQQHMGHSSRSKLINVSFAFCQGALIMEMYINQYSTYVCVCVCQWGADEYLVNCILGIVSQLLPNVHAIEQN